MSTDSKRKRKALARPWLLVVALLAIGLSYSAVAPTTSSADTQMTQQIAEGKAIFEMSCSSCHGLNGEGQSTGPHLHFEIKPDGVNQVDPVPWFAAQGIKI